MSQTDQTRRQRVLQAMQLGPQWRLRASAANSLTSAAPTDHADDAPPCAGLAEKENRSSQIAAMDWSMLQAGVAACTACGLCHGRANTVFGRGDRTAKWLFVGEGPGFHEDQQGQPFVGAAGQLLDNILRALGLASEQGSYIANVVKCRAHDASDKDRVPTADEIAACLPYLHRQIALIQPEMIVALGKTAAIALLGLDAETAVGSLRGRLHDYRGTPVLVTYHPAYLLRKPTEKSKTWADLCLALRAVSAT